MANAHEGSIILPQYLSGEYYATYERPDQDAPFKSAAFLSLLQSLPAANRTWLQSYADVGCGGGGVATQVSDALIERGYPLRKSAGYDVSPHVRQLRHPRVEFLMEDFCVTREHYSLVTLFDVIEHVPDPLGFLQALSTRCDFIALHIPLDKTLVNCFFDRFHHRLKSPGHLSLLDAPAAINLVTMAGITTLNYSYTHGYDAPSGTMTGLQRAMYPLRYAAAHLSPWLAQQTVGGVSLMLIGATKSGLQQKIF